MFELPEHIKNDLRINSEEWGKEIFTIKLDKLFDSTAYDLMEITESVNELLENEKRELGIYE